MRTGIRHSREQHKMLEEGENGVGGREVCKPVILTVQLPYQLKGDKGRGIEEFSVQWKRFVTLFALFQILCR